MKVDALYSLMEGEEVVLEVKIANPRKLGGALAAGNALGALFSGGNGQEGEEQEPGP